MGCGVRDVNRPASEEQFDDMQRMMKDEEGRDGEKMMRV